MTFSLHERSVKRPKVTFLNHPLSWLKTLAQVAGVHRNPSHDRGWTVTIPAGEVAEGGSDDIGQVRTKVYG